VLPHHLHCMYDGLGDAYKGDGRYGIDAQMAKGLAFAPKTSCIQFLIGEWKIF